MVEDIDPKIQPLFFELLERKLYAQSRGKKANQRLCRENQFENQPKSANQCDNTFSSSHSKVITKISNSMSNCIRESHDETKDQR